MQKKVGVVAQSFVQPNKPSVMIASSINGFQLNNYNQQPGNNSNTPLLRGNRPRINTNIHAASNDLNLAAVDQSNDKNLHLPQINSQSALISNQ